MATEILTQVVKLPHPITRAEDRVRWRALVFAFANTLNSRVPSTKDVALIHWGNTVQAKRRRYSFLAAVRKLIRDGPQDTRTVPMPIKAMSPADVVSQQQQQPRPEVDRILMEFRRLKKERQERKLLKKKEEASREKRQMEFEQQEQKRLALSRERKRQLFLPPQMVVRIPTTPPAQVKVNLPPVRRRIVPNAAATAAAPLHSVDIYADIPALEPATPKMIRQMSGPKRLQPLALFSPQVKPSSKDRKEKESEDDEGAETVNEDEPYEPSRNALTEFKRVFTTLQQMAKKKVDLSSKRKFLKFEIADYKDFSSDPRNGAIPLSSQLPTKQLLDSLEKFEYNNLATETQDRFARESLEELYTKAIFKTSTFWLSLERKLNDLAAAILSDLEAEQADQDVDQPRTLTMKALGNLVKGWPKWLADQLLQLVNDKVERLQQALELAADMQSGGEPTSTIDAYLDTVRRELSTFGGLTKKQTAELQPLLAEEYANVGKKKAVANNEVDLENDDDATDDEEKDDTPDEIDLAAQAAIIDDTEFDETPATIAGHAKSLRFNRQTGYSFQRPSYLGFQRPLYL